MELAQWVERVGIWEEVSVAKREIRHRCSVLPKEAFGRITCGWLWQWVCFGAQRIKHLGVLTKTENIDKANHFLSCVMVHLLTLVLIPLWAQS